MEIRANKLAPKSELMTYLGNVPGANGYMFMRVPTNVLFYVVQCIFNEAMFPKCPKQAKQPIQWLPERVPQYQTHGHSSEDEDETPKRRIPLEAKGKGREINSPIAQPPVEQLTVEPSRETMPVPGPETSQLPPPAAPKHSQ